MKVITNKHKSKCFSCKVEGTAVLQEGEVVCGVCGSDLILSVDRGRFRPVFEEDRAKRGSYIRDNGLEYPCRRHNQIGIPFDDRRGSQENGQISF